jgi:hypothetical protein
VMTVAPVGLAVDWLRPLAPALALRAPPGRCHPPRHAAPATPPAHAPAPLPLAAFVLVRSHCTRWRHPRSAAAFVPVRSHCNPLAAIRACARAGSGGRAGRRPRLCRESGGSYRLGCGKATQGKTICRSLLPSPGGHGDRLSLNRRL